MASARAVSPTKSDTEYSFLDALSLDPAHEQFNLLSREKLSMQSISQAVEPSGSLAPLKAPVTVRSFSLDPATSAPSLPQAHRQPFLSEQASAHSKPITMAPPSKAQTQCVQVCERTSNIGDRISVRMLEYLTSVKPNQMPIGLDDLAHGFLSTCQVLLSLQAGLAECSRTGQFFPADLLTELEKKFRICQSDFNMLDQMLGKVLEAERKHTTMSKMKRGLNKLFGEIDFKKMTLALEKTRESLNMSALMFQWTLGSEKIESSMGIGFTGLAAALNRLDSKKSGSSPPQPIDTTRSTPSLIKTQHPELPPLPHLPWSDKSTPGPLTRNSSVDHRTVVNDVHQWSAASSASVSSHERRLPTQAVDRLSSFEETISHHTASDIANEANEPLLEEIATLALGNTAKGVIHLKADPFNLPRWTPRNSTNGDGAGLKDALTAAIRARNHNMVEKLLDRGVSPDTGPDTSALTEAIRVQDSESVRLLLCFGADANECDRDGMSPLLAAVEKSHLPGAITLLKYGANPNLKAGPDRDSPLSLAARDNNMNIAHLLLMYGGDVDQFDGDGETLLTCAINKKVPSKFIEIFLEYGADPNGKSEEGKTPLFEAITSNRVDLVTLLLERGANPNLPGPKHLLWPATYKSNCLKVLLSYGADPKKAPGIMELAASVNNMESVKVLLKAGVDPNSKKDGIYTPLCTSIRDNHPDIFHLLLENGADPNTPASEYPLFKCITHNRAHFMPDLVAAGGDLRSPKGIIETAVSSNNMEALVWLLDQGIDPNDRCPKGRSPLTTAIKTKRIDMVDVLLRRGADPNKRGEGWPVCMAVHTPALLRRVLSVLSEPRAFKGVVERAVAANQLESVKLLLAAGVSVEDKNGGVFSPLTTAIREDHRDIVKFLLDPKGGNADVNAPGEHLPIVKALRRYHGEDTAIIELLLEKGADPNQIYRGWNAMFQAIENGDLNVLKILIEKSNGIDTDIQDEMGRNVVEMAHQRGWDEAVTMIRAGRKLRK